MNIQIEAKINAGSDSKALAGLRMGLSVGIVVPSTPHFGLKPVAKNTLKVLSIDVTPKKTW